MADTLTIIDNRTGRQYEIPIEHNAIRASDLKQIKASGEDCGVLSYDPALTNTACCRSRISCMDVEKGILMYRGYPIEQLAEKSTCLETAYLLLHGDLPTALELEDWKWNITHHTMIHENISKLLQGFRYNAHPMGIFMTTIGALSTLYPEARRMEDPESRRHQIVRIIAKAPTLAAFAYRHGRGLPFSYPDNDLGYAGNFLNMMFKAGEVKYRPNAILERALEVLFIVHADQEQSCSTHTMRVIGSSRVDPFSATAAAIAALDGNLHSDADKDVVRMLFQIGDRKDVPGFIKRVNSGEGPLPGFGHRLYKNHDPRVMILKDMAARVFEVTGKNPVLDVALELERIALEDEHFIQRKLHPNIDFYSGLIYMAMGFPAEMFPVLCAIPRIAGWLAQWVETICDPEQEIARPRQIYGGPARRNYSPVSERQIQPESF